MNNFTRILIIILSNVCIGATYAKAEEGKQLYLKVGIGVNNLTTHSYRNDNYRGKVKLARIYPLAKFGIGYQCTDTIRTELVLNHHFLFNSYENTTDKDGDTFKITYKTKINTLMLNGYKDIITVGNYTYFIGGGLGVSRIKEKAVGTGKFTETGDTFVLADTSARGVNRLNFKLSAGVEVTLSDNIKTELVYNFFNLGYNRPKIIDGMENVARRKYQIHNLTASIRYSL